ncbi:MAG: NACHT domain-containing protein [Anaerolineae bacterium]
MLESSQLTDPMSTAQPVIQQTVVGNNNIFSATGDVYVIQKPAALPASEALTRKDLAILLHKVQTFWIQGVLDRSVHQASRIELGKEMQAGAVDHPWESVLELPDAAGQTLPRGTDILQVFDQANRALLILGEPGSGKTITLLELARGLLQRAADDQTWSEPVPVVLNLSSWSERRPLVEWIVSELTARYQVPASIGRGWLQQHRLLPLLDGLDEVRAEYRAECVKAINAFAAEFGLAGLAVCCRLAEYTQIALRLKLNAAIRLQPLTAEQVNAYLAEAGPRLAALRGVVQTDGALQTLAESPLMLSIMSLAYQDVPAEALMSEGVVSMPEQRTRLFDAYLDKMFKRRGQGRQPFSREQTLHWLAWLARQMTERNQSLFLIEQLQPGWLKSRIGLLAYTLISRLLAGIAMGLALGWSDPIISLFGYPQIGAARQISDQQQFVLRVLYSGLAAMCSAGIIDFIQLQLMERLGQTTRILRLVQLVAGFGLTWFIYAGVFYLADRVVPLESTFEFAKSLLRGFLPALILAWRVNGRTADNDIHSAASLTWSWRRAIRGGLWGSGITAVIWIVLAVLSLLTSSEPASSLTVMETYLFQGTFLGVIVGLIAFAFRGMVRGVPDTRAIPNQGILLSLRSAALVAFITILLIALQVILTFEIQRAFANYEATPGYLILEAILGSLSLAILFSTFAALWFGGMDVIQHYALRALLARTDHAPWNYPRFLNYAADLIFLRRVGGGYLFIHRLLLEHFAAMGKAK